jgi:hypothetical protein
LVEAVYRNELARLCDGADELLVSLPPELALRAWMQRYADFVITKRGMADALRAVIASGAVTSVETRARLSAAIQTMLDAGAAAGSLRGCRRPARRRAGRGCLCLPGRGAGGHGHTGSTPPGGTDPRFAHGGAPLTPVMSRPTISSLL